MSKGFTTFYNEVMYNKSLSTTDKLYFVHFQPFVSIVINVSLIKEKLMRCLIYALEQYRGV